jgi:pimeloyl-ACP methyl ester carboxylesterase
MTAAAASESVVATSSRPSAVPALERTLAILNGAVGDYLDRRGNGLATPFGAVAPSQGGRPVAATAAGFAEAFPAATSRVVVLLHGLMCTELDWRYTVDDQTTDYGASFAKDFAATPVYVRYNTGLSIPENGAHLSSFLEKLVAEFPVAVEEIVLLGFSMGGLVVRSACHVAATALETPAWLPLVKSCFYVGTPHRGAPLERLGRIATRLLGRIPDPYVRLAATLGDLRSAGIKDLGDADLTDAHSRQEKRLTLLENPAHPVPLLPALKHHFIAGTLSEDPLLSRVVGDVMVPVTSATHGQSIPREIPGRRDGGRPSTDHAVAILTRRADGSQMAHMDLAHDPQVYEQIRAWYINSGEVFGSGASPGRDEQVG